VSVLEFHVSDSAERVLGEAERCLAAHPPAETAGLFVSVKR
jgi:hypothetical protein